MAVSSRIQKVGPGRAASACGEIRRCLHSRVRARCRSFDIRRGESADAAASAAVLAPGLDAGKVNMDRRARTGHQLACPCLPVYHAEGLWCFRRAFCQLPAAAAFD
jgi:hypothetical protein